MRRRIALTIGVGLMTLFSVVLATAGRFANDQMNAHYPADHLISPAGDGATVPCWVAARLRTRPDLTAVAELRASGRRLAGSGITVAAADPSALAVAAPAGLLAAVVPARRAARMPVIEGLAAD